MSVIYGRPIVLSSGGGGGYVVSETEPEKINVLSAKWTDEIPQRYGMGRCCRRLCGGGDR